MKPEHARAAAAAASDSESQPESQCYYATGKLLEGCQWLPVALAAEVKVPVQWVDGLEKERWYLHICTDMPVNI